VLIAVCCDRGAPGSTTTALALGLASTEPTVVVEADPYGGDLALRIELPDGTRMPERPTVATLAEAARTIRGTDLLEGKGHELNPSTRIIPGYLSAELASGIADWAALANGLRRADTRVVVDLGRIHSASPSITIAALADVVVVVTRADMDAFKHLVDRIERLHPVLVSEGRKPPVLVPVVVTDKRWMRNMAAQLAEFVNRSDVSASIGHVGALALDEAGVEALEKGHTSGRSAKHPLWLSALQLTADLEALTGHTHVAAAPNSVEADPMEDQIREVIDDAGSAPTTQFSWSSHRATPGGDD
jgi:hypothetical protein